jgi:RimJ/RimL family protein N-acetyltransferase
MSSESLTGVIIDSPRLRLVPTSESYAEDVFQNFTAEITTYMLPAPPAVVDETLQFLRKARSQVESGTDLQVVVLLKPGQEFLGHAGLHGVDTRTPELGIWIKKAEHAHGYGREAVTALADWAVDNLMFEYLKYPVDRRNVPSRRIPESLGGRIEAEYEEVNGSGFRLDLLEYRIYRDALTKRRRSGP